jgi:hypothetical protein
VNFVDLIHLACTKSNFTTLEEYLNFSCKFLDWTKSGLQAVIVCQNEPHYQYWQYKAEGSFNVTRPINSEIMYTHSDMECLRTDFCDLIRSKSRLMTASSNEKDIIKRVIYTIQQSIGSTLDGLPAETSNRARKINGDLFERLIRVLFSELGIDCTSGIVKIPICIDGIEQCKMSYQHDLIIKNGANEVKAIGSVKTSSKDRIDKIFIDKFLFSKLTDKEVPHIAIFLNDVQRGQKTDRSYKVSATFKPGHFKGYSIKLNSLDGVYYCDIRPNMLIDPFLKQHIRTIDNLFCSDIWSLLNKSEGISADIQEDAD